VDLRFLVAVMKINSDLERIGDSAVNIAQSVLQLNEQPPLKPYIDLPRLSLLVQDMVRRSLDAFVRRDARLATEVCESDDAVDGLYKQLFRELLTYMIEDPKTVSAPCTCCSSRATWSASPTMPPTSPRTSSTTSRAATNPPLPCRRRVPSARRCERPRKHAS